MTTTAIAYSVILFWNMNGPLPFASRSATGYEAKKMSFIKTKDGTELFYKDWGTGKPIVFIHGWPLDADMWEAQQPALTEAGFRTIAYDRRGFGRSTQTWDGYDYDTFADDLKAVLDQLDLQDVALVGFSMGGGEIARYMSRHQGARVSKAVLVSSVVPFMLKTSDHDGVPEDVFKGMISGLKKDRAKFLTDFWPSVFGVGMISSPVSPEYLQTTTSMAMLASPKATTDCVDSFGKTDFRGDLPHFKVPTLVIHGDKDETVPFNVSGKAAAEGIQGAKLIVYEGAPHGTPATHADRLTKDLKDFL